MNDAHGILNKHRDIKAHGVLIKRGVKCSANAYSRKMISKKIDSLPFKLLRINNIKFY